MGQSRWMQGCERASRLDRLDAVGVQSSPGRTTRTRMASSAESYSARRRKCEEACMNYFVFIIARRIGSAAVQTEAAQCRANGRH